MDLGERLRKMRKKSNMSATEVAEILGVSKSTISNYENGIRKPGIDKLLELTKIYGVSIQTILDTENFAGLDYFDHNSKKIPILGTIRAGEPIYAEENIIGYTDLGSDYNMDDEYFALYVIGDSMNKSRICEGDIVIVRRQSTVDNGEIAIILIDNEEATVKKFFRNGNSVTLMPSSTNPEHKQRKVNLKENAVEVLGKVVEVKIKL